jgi:type III secretion protein J
MSIFSSFCTRLMRLAALALLVGLSACSGQVELLSSIAERDANEVIAALVNRGIPATKISGKEGMVGIQVDQKQAAKAVDLLRSLGLPRENFTGMGQVFTKSGLISSPLEERARYLYALSQELSGTLSNIDGVLFARVHLVLPERGSGLDKDSLSSASVFLKYQQAYDLEILQPQVKRLVVNSIPGLSTERVSVVLVPSKSKVPGDGAQDGAANTTVWGVLVPAQSATTLRIMGVLALLIVLMLAGAVAYLLWRDKRSPQTGAQDSRA